ncbi:SAM-dependent methyltransferase [Diplocloster agilis]|uniref:Cyclopropane-fatty-acyl-phospholipid synthase family protein n=1 Tax=Diplocloster agilis TaxID=2850323 RepID=A0A949JYM6_9FIRM|nr:cyclopropane-fatty-acyl-phospholipid synthase family protein [Diplocloster agilis]MBU9737633.1 cyclopropane-fatty-acyl-phospholipid synthase family protein [Diplocloster agilis]
MKQEMDYIVKHLEKFDQVPFCVAMDQKEYRIGAGDPKFRVVLRNPIPKTALLTSTSLALGESYMKGDLEVEGDLFSALDLFLGQMERFMTNKTVLHKLIHTSTSMKNQKAEVSSHYDIGNDFYRLWLDETLSYSCGYFAKPQDTLYEAQMGKIHHTLDKLELEKDMFLLDIGCGWGYMLIEAAKKYHVKGIGITLSEEQCKACRQRIEEEGLRGEVQVYVMDYRELAGSGMRFDRVVSVGMLEHVGRQNYELFLKSVDSVLKPSGLFLLHYISALKEHPGDPWIKKYIFPGGMIPSLREMIQLFGDHRYYTLDVESLRRHYVKTLLCWRDNFEKHREEIAEMFDTEFVRMWELYLCSCAASFDNGIVDLHQILLSKGVNNRIPMTRPC